jgi:hypothetical protein
MTPLIASAIPLYTLSISGFLVGLSNPSKQAFFLFFEYDFGISKQCTRCILIGPSNGSP